MRHYFPVILCVLLLGVLRPANAQNKFYLKIESAKQGAFHPTKQRPQGDGFMECKSFEFESTAPVDAGNAKAHGVAKHEPLKVTIDGTVASAQILQASWTKQLLSSVLLELTRRSDIGIEKVYMKISLKNAMISDVIMNSNTMVVRFTYEQMEMTEVPVR
jgi:type VI secretion system Hcp family effector